MALGGWVAGTGFGRTVLGRGGDDDNCVARCGMSKASTNCPPELRCCSGCIDGSPYVDCIPPGRACRTDRTDANTTRVGIAEDETNWR